jgi:hypothetical protein
MIHVNIQIRASPLLASPSSNQYYLLYPCIVYLRCLCLRDIAKLSVVVVVTKVRASTFSESMMFLA